MGKRGNVITKGGTGEVEIWRKGRNQITNRGMGEADKWRKYGEWERRINRENKWIRGGG